MRQKSSFDFVLLGIVSIISLESFSGIPSIEVSAGIDPINGDYNFGATNSDADITRATDVIDDYHGIATSIARGAYSDWTGNTTSSGNYDIYGDRTKS